MSEKELLGLAHAYDDLVDHAQSALRAEFARRGLEPPLVEERFEVEAERLVTVRRYRDLSEALVGRTVLESEGIVCFLQDENFVRLNWFDSNVIGGLRLQVRPEDMDAAEAVLRQPVPETIPFAGGEEFRQPQCPSCGSLDITFEGTDRKAALTSLWAIGLPLPPGTPTWRCHACGSRWVEEAAPEL